MSRKLDTYNDDIIYYETNKKVEKKIKIPITFPKKYVKYLLYHQVNTYKRNQKSNYN